MSSEAPAGVPGRGDLGAFRPRGVVFDIDGTLVHNMPFHADAFAVFAQRHGLPPLTMADRAKLDGKRNSEIFPVLFGRALPREEWMRYEDEKESAYRELSTGRLEPLRGLPRLLALLDARGVRVALATSAPALNVEHTLRELGMEHFHPLTVRADQVARGKPAPDVFLAAAALLDVPAVDCLAFEDAPMGVAAALAAGMRCVAVATSFDDVAMRAHEASPDAVVRDFEEFLAGPGRWLTD